jgi:hypothetical protein
MPAEIDQLIINNPYDEPTEHWTYDRESRTFDRTPGRRPAGYVKATPGSPARTSWFAWPTASPWCSK